MARACVGRFLGVISKPWTMVSQRSHSAWAIRVFEPPELAQTTRAPDASQAQPTQAETMMDEALIDPGNGALTCPVHGGASSPGSAREPFDMHAPDSLSIRTAGDIR